MSKHKALTGAIAALASVATLGALAAPALAADTTYSPNGKSVAELAQHGGAQRIAAIGNKNAKNVVLFIGDGMGDSEITVARDYLKGANGHFDGLDAVGQPGALGDVQAGTGQYTTFSVGNGSKDSAVGKDGDGKLVANPNPGKLTPVTDSSASGSAWATGTKTYNNAVDVDIYGNPQLNLFELAKAAGKATGNVTTAEIQDATPPCWNRIRPNVPATAHRARPTARPTMPPSSASSTSLRKTAASAPSPSSCSTPAPT